MEFCGEMSVQGRQYDTEDFGESSERCFQRFLESFDREIKMLRKLWFE